MYLRRSNSKQNSTQFEKSVVVCCSMLRCVETCAVFCSALHCVALCCNALQCDAATASRTHVFRRVLRYAAVCCSVLQCVAVCCSVLRCFAEYITGFPLRPSWCWDHDVAMTQQQRSEQKTIQETIGAWHTDFIAVCCSVSQCFAMCCSVLQCVAVCCSVLQCVAVCCSVLQCQYKKQSEHGTQISCGPSHSQFEATID